LSGPKAGTFEPFGAVSTPTHTKRALGAPPLADSTRVRSGVTQAGETFLDLGYRLRDLVLSSGMLGSFELLLELGARKPQRLALPDTLRVFLRLSVARRLAFGLQFVHPFLESGIRINQSFACITHYSTDPFVCRGNGDYKTC
jgi:hypothetical protein